MLNQILIGVICTMGVSGYFYYTSTQNELAELKALNSAYELQATQQKEAIESLQKDFALQTQSLNELQKRSNEIQEEMNAYLDIFKRHNLTKLATAKPGLIERRANKGTKDVFDSIENDSRGIDDLDNGLQLEPVQGAATSSRDNN